MYTRTVKRIALAFVINIIATLFGQAAANESPARLCYEPSARRLTGANSVTVNLASFGAVGDGLTDDGPALQAALDSLASSPAGTDATLVLPEGRFAIHTPVAKDFARHLNSLTIVGPTPFYVPESEGHGRGLGLSAEFIVKVGEGADALYISGLPSVVIQDVAFVGDPSVQSDARVVLTFVGIDSAAVRHCEFYGLASVVPAGAIVYAHDSRLSIEDSAFLGCATTTGYNTSVVQNTRWHAINVSDTRFIDYGNRPGFFSKTPISASLSWISIGNAAPLDAASMWREATIRDVLLDEGAYHGITCRPDLFQQASGPIDLVHIDGLYLNVSNLNTHGLYLRAADRVVVERSHFGWSTIAETAIFISSVGSAILDDLELVDDATTIRADSDTGRLAIVNSQYTTLESPPEITHVFNTAPEDDPVQFVRARYLELLSREPDSAGLFYWSDMLLRCESDAPCTSDAKAALDAYLTSEPQPTFTLSGRVTNREGGDGMAGATVTLSGSKSHSVTTDAEGNYQFVGLPSSGAYVLTASKANYTFSPNSQTITTPDGDRTANFSGLIDRYGIVGQVTNTSGTPLAGVTVRLSGSQSMETTTDPGGNYAFDNLPAGGDYTLTPSKTNYTFSYPGWTFTNLVNDQTAPRFNGTLLNFNVGGRITRADGSGIENVRVDVFGTGTASAWTEADGNFSFTLQAEGNYTVRPSRANYTFAPESLTYNGLSNNQTANFTGTLNTYFIRGSITDGVRPLSGVKVTLSGSQIGTTHTAADGTYSFAVMGDGDYTVTPSRVAFEFTSYTSGLPTETIVNMSRDYAANFKGRQLSTFQFAAASYSFTEGVGSFTVTVTRTGDASTAASVVYTLSGNNLQQGSDISTTAGMLAFAPNETSHTITIFVTDDGFQESSETGTIALSNPSDGSYIGSNGTALLTISDNDSAPTDVNPIEQAQFFVRQHYVDFLNREPDASGLQFWTNEIASCGSNAACIDYKRTNVSAAFFLSPEFQATGYFVHRLYKASFNRWPRRVEEFLPGVRAVGEDVVGGVAGSEQKLEQNKAAFSDEFVRSAEFASSYPETLTPQEFVDALAAHTGGPLADDERAAALGEFGAAATSADASARGRALRRIVESRAFQQREYNAAFVLMQYFAYLQRNPDDAPNTDLSGYNFWLSKLNQFGGDFHAAEMVRSFLVSGEYRQRFGN